MVYIAALVFAVFTSQLAWSAPTTPLDQATLLQNGQAAQNLNFQFRTLQATDNCTSGENACISGAIANCVDGKWKTQDCLTGQRCFSLPSVRDNGTFVACTSAKNALSIISATGATGGIFANSNSTSNGTSVVQNATVTVTVVNSPSAVTQPSDTTTLSPAEASSLLSSVSANNAANAIATGSPSSSDTPAATIPFTVVTDLNNGAASSPSVFVAPTATVTLTGTPSGTTTTMANSGPAY